MITQGENSIHAFEVCPEEPPYFLDISPFSTTTPQQAVSFLPKSVCNVREVEYARALRLTKAAIELIEFKVPRNRVRSTLLTLILIIVMRHRFHIFALLCLYCSICPTRLILTILSRDTNSIYDIAVFIL
jgi:hypothetical protein